MRAVVLVVHPYRLAVATALVRIARVRRVPKMVHAQRFGTAVM